MRADEDSDAVAVECLVIQWVDDEPQPGLVEATMTDTDGRTWHFVEKEAVIGASQELTPTTRYPVSGWIACEVLGLEYDATGEPIVFVTTERPWGVESSEGQTEFRVRPTQLRA